MTVHVLFFAYLRDFTGTARVELEVPDGATARDVWAPLLEDAAASHGAWWQPTIDAILREGPLARRILRATGTAPDRRRLQGVYGRLCECLRDGHMFHGRE